MAYTPMFGSLHRERLWQNQCFNARADGLTDGTCPICNICDKPVTRAEAERDGWHESHLPWRGAPAHLRSVGIAHVDCNLAHGRTVVVPAFAKADRIRARLEGRKGPGLGRHPMPAGRLTPITRTMHHGVQPRLTLAQRHARALAALRIVPIEPSELVPADLIPMVQP